MKKNTIIFKDTDTIDYITMAANNTIDILNENHKKVKAINNQLSNKITFYQSFYKYGVNTELNNFLRDNIYQELKQLIKSKSPFFSEEMVQEFYTKMMIKLHANHLEIHENIAREKDNASEEKAKNIKVICNNIPSYFDSYYNNIFEMAKDLISYNEEQQVFEINKEHYNNFVNAMTYTTTNTKQQKIMEQLQIIDKAFQEINKYTKDISHINFLNDNDNSLLIEKQQLRVIQNIK